MSDINKNGTGHNECEPISIKELVQVVVKPFAVSFTIRQTGGFINDLI